MSLALMFARKYAFSAKIRNLQDYYHRAVFSFQPPSGLDIVNTLRYFQQTLLGLLRDVQSSHRGLFESLHQEQERLALFPNLNYNGLFHALTHIIEIFPQVTSGQVALGSNIITTYNHLYLFLDRATVEQLPYTFATLMAIFPTCLYDDLINSLCFVVLPFVLKNEIEECYSTRSTQSVVLLVLQYSDNPQHHTQLLEALMALKPDVHRDVLTVIACGTSEARVPAGNLLFHYWPFLNPNILERRSVQYRTQGTSYKPAAWNQIHCQFKGCDAGAENFVTKKCFDPVACAEIAEMTLPVYLCSSCAVNVEKKYKLELVDVLQPITQMGTKCQNKPCTSKNSVATATCFSTECCVQNKLQPIRLCKECDEALHTGEVAGAAAAGAAAAAAQQSIHMCHRQLPCPWDLPKCIALEFIQSVVSLLKECSCTVEVEQDKRPRWLQQLEGEAEENLRSTTDERRMLSRYGIWLLVGLCTPRPDTPEDAVGRLLAMLFQWFGVTALLSNDAAGVALEQLKSDFICDWLPGVVSSHFDVFVSCLLPSPPEYARVGGTWDTLCTRTDQLKEGLSRILALIPYDIINFRAWDRIMPYWLEAIVSEVPESDLPELKVLLCKIFEIDMCPLPFPPKDIYHFVGHRLKSDEFSVQQQALEWLQVLSGLDIMIPMDILLDFFSGAVRAMQNPGCSDSISSEKPKLIRKTSIGEVEMWLESELRPGSPFSNEGSPLFPQPSPFDPDEDQPTNVSFFVLMLDVIIKQMDLAEIVPHSGLDSAIVQKLLKTLSEIVRAPWTGTHICDNPEYDDFVDCVFCRECTIFYELFNDINDHICPTEPVKIELHPDIDYDTFWDETDEATSPQTAMTMEEGQLDYRGLSARKSMDTVLDIEGGLIKEELETPGVEFAMPNIRKATEEMEMEDLEFVGVLPSEEVETAMAQAITLTETDVGMATCKVVSATLVDEREAAGSASTPHQSGMSDILYWHTTQGKFRFTLEDLPSQLQLLYALLIDVEVHPDPDVPFYLLQSVKYLCLHAEALNRAHREYRGFLIWAQENILIVKFWKLLQAQYSHVSQICVPLILHCLTLPCGPEVFWKLINQSFTSTDWSERFAAVEKFTVIARLLDPTHVRGNQIIQSSLANGFCFLISSLFDPNSYVAQRAMLYIETIPSATIKALCACLESQFDGVINDRPLLIHHLHILSTILPEEPILTWDFFLARFDALSLEAQVKLEQTGEIAFATDLMHSDPMSDMYQRKVARAKAALEQSVHQVRSIVQNMDTALPHQKSINTNLKSKIMKGTPFGGNYSVFDQKTPSAPPSRRPSRREPSHREKQYRFQRGSVHAESGRRKLRKVLTLVRVVRAWQTIQERLSNSLSSLNSSFASGLDTVNRLDDNENISPAFHEAALSLFGSLGIPPPSATDHSKPPRGDSKTPRQSVGSLDPGPTVAKLKEFTDEESNFTILLSKSMDLENAERHTISLMVTLFMKFLGSPKVLVANPDEKAAAKKQHCTSSFERLTWIQFYRKMFHGATLAFAASLYVAFLRSVLDTNLVVGTQILPIATSLLQYLPSPQRYASDNQPANYTIWFLEPHVRQSWLWATLMILYKYRFDQPPINESVLVLVQLIINTLDAHVHLCSQVEVGFPTPLFPRSRAGSANTQNSMTPSPSRKFDRLRSAMKMVVLMVRVVRMWPTSGSFELERRSDSSASNPSPTSITSYGADEDYDYGVLDLQKNSTPENGDSDEESGGPTTSGESRSQARRRMMMSSKKPTFDEREEHELLADDELMCLDEEITEKTGDSVDSRIKQQISAFDRSFDKPDDRNSIVPTRVTRIVVMMPNDLDEIYSLYSSNSSMELRALDEDKADATECVVDALSMEDLSQAVTVTPQIVNDMAEGIQSSLRISSPLPSTVAVRYGQKPSPLSIPSDMPEEQDSLAACQELQSLDASELMTATAGQPQVLTRGLSVQMMPSIGPGEVTVAPALHWHSGESPEEEKGQLAVHVVEPKVAIMPPRVGRPASQKIVVSSAPQSAFPMETVSSAQVQVMHSTIGDDMTCVQATEVRPTIMQPTVLQPTVLSDLKVADKRAASKLVESQMIHLEPVVEEDPAQKNLLSVPQTLPVQSRRSSVRGQAAPSVSGELPPICTGSMRYAESTVLLRCTQCNAALEYYDEDTIGLGIVCLSTFVHREPAMAAPFLMRILEVVTSISNHVFHPWQNESNLFVPGNCKSIARQFLRVVLHQLAGNRLFLELFQAEIQDPDFFHGINSALMDFPELNPVMVIQILLEDMLQSWPVRFSQIMYNLSDYMSHVPMDLYLQSWGVVTSLMESFFRRFTLEMTELPSDMTYIFKIIVTLLKVNNFYTLKSSATLMDPLCKLLCQALQTVVVNLKDVLELCTACSRAFVKDRDKQCISRCMVSELVNALKFKTVLPHDNYLTIVQFLLQDAQETISPEIDSIGHTYNTGASEAARPYTQDFIDFIADLHVLNKIKSAPTVAKGPALREDTLGGDLKASLSRYVAVEISRTMGRDLRSIIRYLPWLFAPPSVTQQGPTEFIDTVAHVRLLSWILLGALSHNGSIDCLPVPLDASQVISDHIQFVLAGFAEKSKESVLHMSALFHAFHLCQLWTIYCEQADSQRAVREDSKASGVNIIDFWARITPAILQLLSHSKVLADMVNLHFLNTIEALQECRSSVLAKLYALWQPILMAYHSQVPSHLIVRIDTVENQVPTSGLESEQLSSWLRRIQLKISKIELQSAVATRIYSV